jgi:Lhr-like helicase
MGPDEDALEDDEPVGGLAAPGLADAGSERRWLSNLAAAAQRAARDESKTRFLLRLLARLRRRGAVSALIFTEYRDTLARLVERLTSAGYDVAMLHGGLTAPDRSLVQCQFNRRGGILLATDAAAEGLNLHHRCRLVIHYELPWNPTRLEQRCGRVDRLGQTARVHELGLVAEHTAERLVVSPLLARLRGAGLRQKRMLDALAESHVAAAVMGGAVVDTENGEAAPLPSTVAEAPGDLSLSAVREVSRLEDVRSLIRRSQRAAAKRRPSLSVSTLRGFRSPARALYVFLALRIRNSDGLILHSDLLAVQIDFVCPRSGADALHIETRLLEILSDLTAREDFIHSLAASRASRELSRITELDALRRHRQHERWHAIRDNISGGQLAASRLLVQQGLFDRRSVRAAAARAASHTRQLEAIEEVVTSSSLSIHAEAIAALLVIARA